MIPFHLFAIIHPCTTPAGDLDRKFSKQLVLKYKNFQYQSSPLQDLKEVAGLGLLIVGKEDYCLSLAPQSGHVSTTESDSGSPGLV